jgi:hypothetical protein
MGLTLKLSGFPDALSDTSIVLVRRRKWRLQASMNLSPSVLELKSEVEGLKGLPAAADERRRELLAAMHARQ